MPESLARVGASLPEIEGYDVLSLLGRGGMGRVFKARHRTLGRVVALKMLIDASEPMLIARFHAESQAVAQLQHPNIAQVFESGQIDGQPYLVLEYLDGGSLAQKLDGKPVPPREAAGIVEILARAIEHSHQHNILHRDLKPANILLAGDGTPKITDFGLARRLNEGSKLTRTGEVLGTPSYMAPEQASGVVPNPGPAVDIYALGAILYEMLTGRPPFQGPDTMQTLLMVLTVDPVPPRHFSPSLPRDLETICLKCLEKSARKRYGKAQALAEDLRRFLDGQPILARPVRWWERTLKWAKRRPWAAAFLGLLVVALVGLAAASVQIYSANRRLEARNREITESLQLARNAIDSMLVDLSQELAPTPLSEEIQRKALEKARGLYERLVAIRPDDRDGRTQAADAYGSLGRFYARLGRLDDAEAIYRKALAMHERLKQEEPTVADHRRGCANMLLNLANLARSRGKDDQTEALARSALAEIGPLLTDAEPVTLQAASAIHNTLALALRSLKRPAESAREHEAALSLRKQWLALEPNNTDAKIALASSLSNKATFLLTTHPTDAITALADAEKLLAGQTAPQQRFYLGQFRANRAIAYEQLKKNHEAEATHALAIATLTALVADYSAVPGYRHLLAKEHMNLARYFAPKGQSERALRHFRIAGPLLERLVQEFPDNGQFRAERDLCRKFTGWVEEDLAEQKKKKT
ncbi:MAG: protein kinase [Planctomycetes bacterium]|nr:protein kinase [Planctomycetota bacterium]